MDPWVYQLDISEMMTQCWGGHEAVCPAANDALDGAIRVTSFLEPSLLVSKLATGVELWEHVLHIIGCQEVCNMSRPKVRGEGIQVHIQVCH